MISQYCSVIFSSSPIRTCFSNCIGAPQHLDCTSAKAGQLKLPLSPPRPWAPAFHSLLPDLHAFLNEEGRDPVWSSIRLGLGVHHQCVGHCSIGAPTHNRSGLAAAVARRNMGDLMQIRRQNAGSGLLQGAGLWLHRRQLIQHKSEQATHQALQQVWLDGSGPSLSALVLASKVQIYLDRHWHSVHVQSRTTMHRVMHPRGQSLTKLAHRGSLACSYLWPAAAKHRQKWRLSSQNDDRC